MAYHETQQSPLHNSQLNPQLWALFNPHNPQLYGQSFGTPSMQGIGYGLGQAAYGQQYGQYGYGGQPSIGALGHGGVWGAQPQWWGQQQPQWWGQQQRQLSQQDVSEVVRQLLPALPQILAQAQQPQAAIGYAAYGQAPRLLTPQDVNEVVRQILPVVPQIVGMLQGQPQLQHVAMHGGSGFAAQNPFATSLQQPALGQYGWPQFQSAFGAPPIWAQPQRQLSQQDVADVTRQLAGLIPQVIGNLQALNQQRMI
jgi:hypothetical protein